MSTQQKNLIDALRASLTKPQKNKNRTLFICCMEAKSAKIGQSQKLCSRTLLVTRELKNLLALNNMPVFSCF